VRLGVAYQGQRSADAVVALAGDEVDFAALLQLSANASGLVLEPEDIEVDDGLQPVDSSNGTEPGRAAATAADAS